MKLRRWASLRLYSLPAAPLRPAQQPPPARRGVLLRLSQAAGQPTRRATKLQHVWHGFGDAAPWPGFGSGASLSQLRAALQAALPQLCAAPQLWPAATPWQAGAWQAWHAALQQFLQQLPEALPREAQHAVETAWLDLQAQRAGLPLVALLCRTPQAPERRVPVHLLVHSVASAQDAVQAGAQVLKIKLGAQPLADDVAYVAAIARAVGPAVALRLDANAAWSLPVAQQAVQALAKWAPAWLEQPVAATAVAALAQLRRLRLVPIAADEAVHTAVQLQQILACAAADVVVLKPMFAGGLLATCALAAQAWQQQVQVIVTHALESAVGRAAAAHLAAALQSERHVAGLPSLACGLASALPARDDVAQGPKVQRGVCVLTPQPGLGLRWSPSWQAWATAVPAMAPAKAHNDA